LPTVKVGKRALIDLHAWMASQQVEAK
jgi:hypothetical protein